MTNRIMSDREASAISVFYASIDSMLTEGFAPTDLELLLIERLTSNDVDDAQTIAIHEICIFIDCLAGIRNLTIKRKYGLTNFNRTTAVYSGANRVKRILNISLAPNERTLSAPCNNAWWLTQAKRALRKCDITPLNLGSSLGFK